MVFFFFLYRTFSFRVTIIIYVCNILHARLEENLAESKTKKLLQINRIVTTRRRLIGAVSDDLLTRARRFSHFASGPKPRRHGVIISFFFWRGQRHRRRCVGLISDAAMINRGIAIHKRKEIFRRGIPGSDNSTLEHTRRGRARE